MTDAQAATLRDVAMLAGVHVGTASRALSTDQSDRVRPTTRKRVIDAAKQLGYRPNAVAQSLRKGSTATLGVVVADLSNPYFAQLLRGIDSEAQQRGVLPLVAETHEDPKKLRTVMHRLLTNRVDAIILSAAHQTDESFIAELENQLPVVLAVRTVGSVEYPTNPTVHRREVLQNDVEGTRAAVKHLVSLGHTQIAQLRGPSDISSFVDRCAGYQSEMRRHSQLVDVSDATIAQASTIQEGYRMTSMLLSRDRTQQPTGIVAHNDLMAVGALDAIRDMGLRCPEDVSVIGYNDAPLIDHVYPPLSTIRLPSFEIGRQSARLAFSALDNHITAPVRIMLMPDFVKRESTGPASS
ncbi:MAG: LacI family DNA-binding transcriptional regulator [Gulosibacter sp.]|uniref:LacI family DNA-binding transcriptional regulator n=1 Tax=Gulosibacter sp. TaxID=2817531 RepID=UPI003F92A310